MPFKPNYNQRRADRRRAQQQKQDEKQQRREEKAAQRKAARGEPSPPAQPLSVEDNNMARKNQPTDNAFVLFDVVYEDGTRSSNRKVAAAELDVLDADASARAVIEAQDRKIAEMSGRPRAPIKSIGRSAAR